MFNQNEKIKVEFVCEGNFSRSELARLYANKWLKDERLEREYDITSSGIYVNTNGIERLDKFSDKEISSFLKAGINYNFFKDTKTIDAIYESINTNDRDKKINFFIQTAGFISEMESKYREIYRKKLGLTEKFKTERTQTIANSHAHGIFSMNHNIDAQAKRIYLTGGYSALGENHLSNNNPTPPHYLDRDIFFSSLDYRSEDGLKEITNELIDGSFEKTYDNAVAFLEKNIPYALKDTKKLVDTKFKYW